MRTVCALGEIYKSIHPFPPHGVSSLLDRILSYRASPRTQLESPILDLVDGIEPKIRAAAESDAIHTVVIAKSQRENLDHVAGGVRIQRLSQF